jgi:ribosomal protein S18 acetylase RimI-like enzyme
MVRLFVTYMEQRQGLDGEALVPSKPDACVIAERLNVTDYLRLYRIIGEPVQWDDRLRMPPEALTHFLADTTVYFFILYVGSSRLGLCEAVHDMNNEIEITHFGLVPEAQGQKLGSFLLDHALRALWARQPRRIWLHTDTNDHPRAVKTYERAGFQIYERRWEDFPD